jgi:IS30 family transposase
MREAIMSYYHHFTICERAKIEELNKLGFSTRSIAKRICRHHSSVARELKRLGDAINYKAEAACADYAVKRINSKPRGKHSIELCKLVKDKILVTWSPEQIANTITLGKLSFKTIYRWIYDGKIDGITMVNLRRRGKKRTCNNLVLYSRGTSIRKRPKEVYSRKTLGHWELDTVVSGKTKGGCFATFIERKTRLYTAIKMPDRTAGSMEVAIKQVYSLLPNPSKTFITATTDRGGEFACFENIQNDLGVKVYFADPYCSHQRDSNEYGNGLLREFYPKGTNLANVSEDELNHSLMLINNRPRKCLGWISPVQAFAKEVSQLG